MHIMHKMRWYCRKQKNLNDCHAQRYRSLSLADTPTRQSTHQRNEELTLVIYTIYEKIFKIIKTSNSNFVHSSLVQSNRHLDFLPYNGLFSALFYCINFGECPTSSRGWSHVFACFCSLDPCLVSEWVQWCFQKISKWPLNGNGTKSNDQHSG